MKRLFFLALATSLLPVAASAQPSLSSAVLTENDAYVLMPPVVISQAQSLQMKWSPDGAYLLLFRAATPTSGKSLMDALRAREMPGVTASLILWDNLNKKAIELWKGDTKELRLEEFRWFAKSPVALIHLTKTRVGHSNEDDGAAARPTSTSILLRVDAPTAKVQTLPLPSTEHDPLLSFSPVSDLATWTIPNFNNKGALDHSTMHFIRPSGPISKPLDIGDHTMADDSWTPEGMPVMIRYDFEPNKKPQPSYKLVNVDTLQMESIQQKPALYKPQAVTAPLVGATIQGHTVSARETRRNVRALWLHSAVPSKFQYALIAAEVDEYALSPDLQTVAYISQGIALVRDIAKMPRGVIEAALEAAVRMELMTKSKEVGLGLIMLATDSDDNLPGKDADLNALVGPYLKDPSLLNGFVYTFGGGNLSKIDQPADTPIGYTPGPGGRAVVYADGHVKWVKDDPKG